VRSKNGLEMWGEMCIIVGKANTMVKLIKVITFKIITVLRMKKDALGMEFKII